MISKQLLEEQIEEIIENNIRESAKEVICNILIELPESYEDLEKTYGVKEN